LEDQVSLEGSIGFRS